MTADGRIKGSMRCVGRECRCFKLFVTRKKHTRNTVHSREGFGCTLRCKRV